ncbi:unnamed protein product [Ectocarpus sp. 12 AP-2014]
MRSDDGSPLIYSFCTPPLITNHSSHRQSSFRPIINVIHASPNPLSLQPRYQPIALHRWILYAGCFYGCSYTARSSKSRPIASCNTSAHAPVVKQNIRKDRADSPPAGTIAPAPARGPAF